MDSTKNEDGTAPTTKESKYLALVPRGLQHVISDLVLDATCPSTKLSFLGEQDDNKVGQEAKERLLLQQQQKEQKRATKASSTKKWCQHPVGSVELTRTNHVSVGYSSTAKKQQEPQTSWSCPGQLSGSVWLQTETSKIESMASLRCLGPLMALVSVGRLACLTHETNCKEQEMVQEISQWIACSTSYRQDLEAALQLWRDYVNVSWRRQLSDQQFASLQERIQSNQLLFRVSCIRETGTTEAPYSRQDLLTSIMIDCGDVLLQENRKDENGVGWQVSLDHFDIELVFVLLASSGTVALGIALCPYSFLKAKSFGSGNVPPDITPPYVGGEILSGLVRLRPTTAHILLHLAEVERHEVVLDPCAGIGTIPVTADQYYHPRNTPAIGLGGDIVLNHPTIASAAGVFEQKAATTKNPASSLLAAWDAAHLPVRSSSVDAIVSDLPFGQQCLSTSALNQLLPLIFLQCARVLTPTTGRMVLLCGSPNTVFPALELSESYWLQPCSIVTPVTIGGLLAWIVRVERSNVIYDEKQNTRILERVRKLANKRDRIALLHENDSISSKEKSSTSNKRRKRRIQS